jgi:dienelactone hydrolase
MIKRARDERDDGSFPIKMINSSTTAAAAAAAAAVAGTNVSRHTANATQHNTPVLLLVLGQDDHDAHKDGHQISEQVERVHLHISVAAISLNSTTTNKNEKWHTSTV